MVREGASLHISFDFSENAGSIEGRFSFATQRVMEYPLDTVRYVRPQLHFELGGEILFDGKLAVDILRRKGLAEADITKALVFLTLFLQVARTGQGWDRLDAALPAAQQEKWFAEVAPPAKDNWLWSFYQKIGDYDPLPFWEKVTVPVLLVYGERDWLVNPAESTAKIEQALQKAGNQDYSIVLLPRAERNLTIQAEPGQPFTWWHVAPGLPDLLTAWVQQRVDCWK
jgi:pimeloyl-ACP methyl ester carboxylesterase